jgi:hypothetical protein
MIIKQRQIAFTVKPSNVRRRLDVPAMRPALQRRQTTPLGACVRRTYSPPIFGASICARCLPGFYAPASLLQCLPPVPKGNFSSLRERNDVRRIQDGVQIVDYALAVYFGHDSRDGSERCAATVGWMRTKDVVSVLVSADTSFAFNVSTSDIPVASRLLSPLIHTFHMSLFCKVR